MLAKQVSHYQILEKIGEGGMGVVYKAHDTKLKRTVALKFLPTAFSMDKQAKTRFIHEAQAASALQHPNICTIHEIEEIPPEPGVPGESQIFICMAYYEGETLKKKIKHGAIPWKEAVQIAISVAKDLKCAHQAGIIHRDIKPANIMVTPDGEARIVDFGLAKLAGQTRLTQAGAITGTVAYMSPEQTRGDQVDQRTDIWALGVIFYEMVTGRLPFRGEYDQAIIYSLMNEEPPQVIADGENIPPGLPEIMGKCLKKDPAQRYQNLEDFIRDILTLKDGQRQILETTVPKIKAKKIQISFRVKYLFLIFPLLLALFFLFRWIESTRSVGSDKNLNSYPNALAVMYLENLQDQQDTSRVAEMITNFLITDLSSSPYVQVISTQRLQEILGDMGKRGTRFIDKSDQIEVAWRARVEQFITGTISQLGSKSVLTAQLINTENGRIIKSEKVSVMISMKLSID